MLGPNPPPKHFKSIFDKLSHSKYRTHCMSFDTLQQNRHDPAAELFRVAKNK